MMQRNRVPATEWRVFFALFFAAWAVRLIGLDYGYFHGDERINQAAQVLAGQLIPEQHFYPPLMHYILAIIYAGMYGLGRVSGVWADTEAFRTQYFEDPTVFYLVARALTGAISALMTPLFYRFARIMSFGRAESFCFSLLAMLAPSSIYLSYIFKGDVAMASASVLTILLLVRKWQEPATARFDFALGIAVVLGVSFKQLFVFLAFHYYVVFLFVFAITHGLRYTFISTLRILLTIVLVWPILNIGVVLDFENFLEFQKIQSVMSTTTGGSLWESLLLMVQYAVHWQLGLGYVTPVAFLLFPLFAFRMERPALLIGLWCATVFTIFLVVEIVRLRQPEHLWVSYFMVAQLFGGIVMLLLFRMIRPVGAFFGALALGVAAIGTISIWQQTLARPISEDIARFVETNLADRKVMSTVELPINRSLDARLFERARAERTAQKYQITLPEIAPERLQEAPGQAYFVVPPPVVMFGLEGSSEQELEGVIKPFAWPPQPQDWVLQNWLNDGVDIFVVADVAHKMEKERSAHMRAFYRDIVNRCSVLTVYAARKPIYLESDTTVFDCRRE